MKNVSVSLLAALGLLAAVPAHSALLTLEIFDNGSLVGLTSSATGTADIVITSDAAFSTLDLSAVGSPLVPNGDLSSVTLNVTSAAITTTHTLTIDVLQTGITAGRATDSTFTTNDLIGAGGIGPTTESTFVDGTSTTLGTLVATHTFPLATVNDTVGPLSVLLGANAFADAQQYVVGFNAPSESANDTIQFTAGSVPEPSTWAMLMLGFGLMAVFGWRRAKTPRVLSI